MNKVYKLLKLKNIYFNDKNLDVKMVKYGAEHNMQMLSHATVVKCEESARSSITLQMS